MVNIWIKRTLAALLSVGKALFSAVVQVAWGIAGFFLLVSFIAAFKQDISVISGLMTIIQFMTRNWGLFFAILFFYDLIVYYSEAFKAMQKEEKKVSEVVK